MAKIKNRTKADMSALTSDQVFIQRYGNRGTLVSAANRRKKSKSERLKATNERHKEASRWAKKVYSDPALKELYSKRIDEDLTNARLVAIKDFMTAPKIHYVKAGDYQGAVGNPIRIKATDDFQVIAVTVTITNAAGKLEEGAAIRYRRKPAMWVYTSTATNPELAGAIIQVTAEDRPGNKTLQEITIGNGDEPHRVTRSEVMLVKIPEWKLLQKKK